MKDVQLEYVISGTSYMRLNHSYFIDNQDSVNYAKSWLTKARTETHSVSALYNAYVESNYPDKYYQTGINKDFRSIYADSGGLQIVTRGSQIDEDTKKKIYQNQGQHSDFAMCFDEIPVGFVGDKSKRNDYVGRYLDVGKLDECGRRTGQNINEQINVFKEYDGRTIIPVIIVHGQDYDTYMKWTEALISEVSDENQKYLKCVAISSASGGSGELEEIRKYFLFKHLPLPSVDHMHILGVGAIKRLSPLMLLIKKGVFDGFRISYDSTTHSSSGIMGRAFIGDRVYQLGRKNNEAYKLAYERIQKINPLGYSQDEFFRSLNMSVTGFHEEHGSDYHVIQSNLGLTFLGIHDFVRTFEAHLADYDKLLTLFEEDVTLYKYLYEEVHSLDDYFHWEKEAGRFIRSKCIADFQKSTLLFD